MSVIDDGSGGRPKQSQMLKAQEGERKEGRETRTLQTSSCRVINGDGVGGSSPWMFCTHVAAVRFLGKKNKSNSHVLLYSTFHRTTSFKAEEI